MQVIVKAPGDVRVSVQWQLRDTMHARIRPEYCSPEKAQKFRNEGASAALDVSNLSIKSI